MQAAPQTCRLQITVGCDTKHFLGRRAPIGKQMSKFQEHTGIVSYEPTELGR